MRYEIKIGKKSFEAIKGGQITVDLGLNDPERQKVTSDDLIIFTNAEDENERAYARVRGYYVYQSFAELFSKVDKAKLGCKPDYSDADEKKYGVKGIKFEYLPRYKEIKDMTEAEAREFLRGLIKDVKKMRRRLCNNIEKNDNTTKALADFVGNSPELFFCSIDETENDMFKRILSESIKNTQNLIDKIQEYEDKVKG